MISHVDYDPAIWEYNVPNTYNGSYVSNGKYMTNTHQRLTLFHANNRETVSNALYPYADNNSLTANTKPAAKVYCQT